MHPAQAIIVSRDGRGDDRKGALVLRDPRRRLPVHLQGGQQPDQLPPTAFFSGQPGDDFGINIFTLQAQVFSEKSYFSFHSLSVELDDMPAFQPKSLTLTYKFRITFYLSKRW